MEPTRESNITPIQVLLALGSNLGNREGYIRCALQGLSAKKGVYLVSVSDMFETEPIGPPQPDYINAAALIETTLTPNELLLFCKELELQAGRQPSERWGARTLDIDIVLFGCLTIETPQLTIPHPEFRRREFVLKPCSQIAPGMIDPITEKSVQCLLKELQTQTGAI